MLWMQYVPCTAAQAGPQMLRWYPAGGTGTTVPDAPVQTIRPGGLTGIESI